MNKVYFDKTIFCIFCGNKLINQDCNNCLNNLNALKEFEDEND